MVLTCVSLMASDAEHFFFTYLLATCNPSFDNYLVKSFAHSSTGLNGFFVVESLKLLIE